MKLDERYEIKIVIIELIEDKEFVSTGDVYNDFSKFKKDHSFSHYKFGFIVFDNKLGYVPDNCNDWNDTPEEAISDYLRNCR